MSELYEQARGIAVGSGTVAVSAGLDAAAAPDPDRHIAATAYLEL
jgi:hypothetical protein